jgi:hypothetical protein
MSLTCLLAMRSFSIGLCDLTRASTLDRQLLQLILYQSPMRRRPRRGLRCQRRAVMLCCWMTARRRRIVVWCRRVMLEHRGVIVTILWHSVSLVLPLRSRTLGIRQTLVFRPLLALPLSASRVPIIAFPIPLSLHSKQRRIVFHRINIRIQFLAAQEHTRLTFKAVIVEVECMPRIGGTIQAAVPGAEEVGVRAGGVGCEVDYAHFGSRGMRLCVWRKTGSCCAEVKAVVMCALVVVADSES